MLLPQSCRRRTGRGGMKLGEARAGNGRSSRLTGGGLCWGRFGISFGWMNPDAIWSNGPARENEGWGTGTGHPGVVAAMMRPQRPAVTGRDTCPRTTRCSHPNFFGVRGIQRPGVHEDLGKRKSHPPTGQQFCSHKFTDDKCKGRGRSDNFLDLWAADLVPYFRLHTC